MHPYILGVYEMTVQNDIIRYMDSLAASFQADKAEGIDAVVQMNFLDDKLGSWYVEIHEKQCTVNKGQSEDPTITVSVDPQIFLDIQSGKIMANMAVSRGKMQLSGDLSLAFRIGSCFKLPRGLKFQLL